MDSLHHLIAAWGNDHVVVYCDCPDEVSAVRVCRQLRRRGIHRARPLQGGLEAWSAEGLPLEGTPTADAPARLPALA